MCDECAKKSLSHPKHGETGTRLHHIWINMRWRCRSDPQYSGVKDRYVCDEWEDYTVFRDWALTNGYADNLSLDRINNDGPYAPWNCRWATSKIQSNNKGVNHKITANGMTMNVTEWAELLGVPAPTLFSRVHTGASDEDIINTPFIKHTTDIEYQGEIHSISEWARIRGIIPSTLSNRLRSGWPIDLALNTPACNLNRLEEDEYGKKIVKHR